MSGGERDREREKERERLLEKGDRKREEESSEEKDEDRKEKNSSNAKEIVVPQGRMRRSRPLYKPSTINKRFRYRRFPASEQGVGSVQLSKSKELNDGRSILLDEVQNKKPHHNSAVKKRAARMRRADEGANPLKDVVEAKKQERKDSSDSSSNESAPKRKSRRSFNTAELIPRGKPSPYDTQSEEVMERDKTLRSIYPSQFL